MTEWYFLFLAFFWLIPFLMAFLTVTLKDKPNRWANIIIGVVFVVLNFVHFVEHAMEPTAHQLIIVGATVIGALLIVYYAWNWPE
jgi:hypothetical protein